MRARRWLRWKRRWQSHSDDLTDRQAVREPVEAFVELIELDVLAQQAIDRQTTGTVQLDVARNVARRIAAAEITAFDRALLRDDTHVRDREQVLRIRQPCGHS